MTTTTADPPVVSTRRRGVFAFLAICFLWSWSSLGIARVAGFDLDDPVVQLATMALVPASSAVIVRAWITREGFSDAGLRPRISNHWRSYLVALTIPVAVLALSLSIATVIGVWDPTGADLGAAASPAAAGPLIAVAASVIFLGEEFGWTAYLRDRLLPGRPVATTFATGLIWGVWHFPLPWVGYFGGDTPVVDAVWAMVLWLPLSILLEFLIGWLWARTGSVWPGAMLHAGCNLTTSVGMENALGQHVSVTTTTVIYCAALVPFVAGIVVHGHLGSSPSSRIRSVGGATDG